MTDIDNLLQFWIKDVPYIWVDGGSAEKSKRYYLFEDCLYFDSHNKVITERDYQNYQPKSDYSEDFSIIPFSKECSIQRNYFLVFLHASDIEKKDYILSIALGKKIAPFSKYEFRMNGKKIDDFSKVKKEKVTIISEDIDIEVNLLPRDLAVPIDRGFMPFINAGFNWMPKIVDKISRKTIFRNFSEYAKDESEVLNRVLSIKELQDMHSLLKNPLSISSLRYDYFFNSVDTPKILEANRQFSNLENFHRDPKKNEIEGKMNLPLFYIKNGEKKKFKSLIHLGYYLGLVFVDLEKGKMYEKQDDVLKMEKLEKLHKAALVGDCYEPQNFVVYEFLTTTDYSRQEFLANTAFDVMTLEKVLPKMKYNYMLVPKGVAEGNKNLYTVVKKMGEDVVIEDNIKYFMKESENNLIIPFTRNVIQPPPPLPRDVSSPKFGEFPPTPPMSSSEDLSPIELSESPLPMPDIGSDEYYSPSYNPRSPTTGWHLTSKQKKELRKKYHGRPKKSPSKVPPPLPRDKPEDEFKIWLIKNFPAYAHNEFNVPTSLELSNKKDITSIPKTIAKQKNIYQLTIDNLDISEIPKEIFMMKDLKRIYLKNLNLKNLLVPSITRLDKLYLSNVKIQGEIEIYSNSLEVVTFKFCNVEKLEIISESLKLIDIEKTSIKSLDVKTDSLHSIVMKNSTIKNSSIEAPSLVVFESTKTIFDMKSIKNAESIKSMLLENIDLSKNPVNFSTFKNLSELLLVNTNLSEIPKSVYSLKKLKKLFIPHNPIKNIDSKFGDLKNLEYLDITNTGINYFPESIMKMLDLTIEDEYGEIPVHPFTKDFTYKINEGTENTPVLADPMSWNLKILSWINKKTGIYHDPGELKRSRNLDLSGVDLSNEEIPPELKYFLFETIDVRNTNISDEQLKNLEKIIKNIPSAKIII